MKKPLPVIIEIREGDLSKSKRQISFAFDFIFASAEINIIQRRKNNANKVKQLTTNNTKVQ